VTASDNNCFVILDGVTIAGVQSGYLVWELAGDEKLCDSKRSVTLNVVILNGFDCRYYGTNRNRSCITTKSIIRMHRSSSMKCISYFKKRQSYLKTYHWRHLLTEVDCKQASAHAQ